MSAMYGEELRRVPMLLAYYDVLNADERFLKALRDLDESDGDPIRTGSYPRDTYLPLQAFAQAWHLPEDRGRLDLFWCLRGPKPLRLTWSGSSEAKPEAELVVPYISGPFHYDPSHMSRAGLRDHARREASRVERSIVDQAAAIDASFKEKGHDRIPPAHRSEKLLRQGATRLYRRAVLNWTYVQIADEEARVDAESRGQIGEDAIWRSVNEWSERLKVAVPSRGLPTVT